MSDALSWISEPLECSPLECVAYFRPSAMMLLLKVTRYEVPLRHSSGVLPVKRGPDADRFSSVAQVSEQWSTITSCPAIVETASQSPPERSAPAPSPGR